MSLKKAHGSDDKDQMERRGARVAVMGVDIPVLGGGSDGHDTGFG